MIIEETPDHSFCGKTGWVVTDKKILVGWLATLKKVIQNMYLLLMSNQKIIIPFFFRKAGKD